MVAADKNELRARWKVDRRAHEARAMVGSGNRLLGSHMATEIPDELGGRRCRCGGQTTGGDGERRSQHELGGGGIQICLDGGPQAQQHPRQLVVPVHGGEARLQGFLEAAVQALHEPIALRVEGGRRVQVYPQGCGHGGPQGGGELSTTVRSYQARQAKPRNPVEEEGSADGDGGGVGDGDRLRPPGETVHDGEEMGETVGRRQRAHQVQMDMLETRGGHGNVLDGGAGVAYNLGPLARDTGGDELMDIFGQLWPEKSVFNQRGGGLDARMGEIVQVGDDAAAEGLRDKGARGGLGQLANDELGRIRKAHETKA